MKPLLLLILDGWGYRENCDHNAIAKANTPHWDRLWREQPHILLNASGESVGVPKGQMGNSEVGHLHMGAGRLLAQDLVRIDKAINEGNFDNNPVFVSAIKQAIHQDKAVHILGLLSCGGIHSHERHIFAILQLAAKLGVGKIYLHALLDGRDTPPRFALTSLQSAQEKLNELGIGEIASICGRYYAMDRDRRWERTKKAYDMLTAGKADFKAHTAEEALRLAYKRDENDEFVKPTLIYQENEKPATIQDGDVVIFMNFRADRARQLTRALTEEKFTGFKREYWPQLSDYITLTEYAKDIKARIAFLPLSIDCGFGEYIAKEGLKQLRIAETEKYAHVTFFFNGGREAQYEGEDRKLVPSPQVDTYDLKPEMSAFQLTDALVERIKNKDYDVIICNYANPDMVGHTGNFDATVQAIEVIDQCVGKIIAALHSVEGEVLITADHGNAECMYDSATKQNHTAHTLNLVPLVYYGRSAKFLVEQGTLSDIAPTMLYLLGLEIPKQMTGRILLKLN